MDTKRQHEVAGVNQTTKWGHAARTRITVYVTDASDYAHVDIDDQ